jgi:hypothetical protein
MTAYYIKKMLLQHYRNKDIKLYIIRFMYSLDTHGAYTVQVLKEEVK